jgi:hypothetical protein
MGLNTESVYSEYKYEIFVLHLKYSTPLGRNPAIGQGPGFVLATSGLQTQLLL